MYLWSFSLCNVYLLLFSDFYPGPTATPIHLYPSNRAWRSHRQRKFKSRGRPREREETARVSMVIMILSRDVTNDERTRGASNTHATFSELAIFQYYVITAHTHIMSAHAYMYRCISTASSRCFDISDITSFTTYHVRFYIDLYQYNAI